MNLLAELKSSGRVFGTCPVCASEFRMKDASLFAASDELPVSAVARIAEMKAALKERKQQIAALRQRMTTTAARTVESVNLGKILEKIVPSISGFSFRPRDCRALYEPIDYVIFEGLTATGASSR
jgi:predicted Holliday junction resolvase-like endonuclease